MLMFVVRVLIQCGTANDLPSIGDPGKDDVNTVPGGWNRMRVPSGGITVPSVLFMLQVGAYWLQLSLEYPPATIPAALALPFGRGDRGCLIAAKCITAGEFLEDPRRFICSCSSPNWGMTLVIGLREIRRQEIRLKDVALCEPRGVSQVGQQTPYGADKSRAFC
jgi:hypothetical protein